MLLWVGTRSYGLYLYHWPIYQMMRRVPGRPLSVPQFLIGAAIACVVTELSYRFIETPIRKGHVGRWWRKLQAGERPASRGGSSRPRRPPLVAVSVFAAANLATAELRPNEIDQSLRGRSGGQRRPDRPDRVHDGPEHHARRRRPEQATESTKPPPATTAVPAVCP